MLICACRQGIGRGDGSQGCQEGVVSSFPLQYQPAISWRVRLSGFVYD